ncbi:TspO/MBR family protein [Roseibium aestuarii]|uniref:TspO/MBR family protein n=1 Tax=Roseibium aestuarii TaxID=2600299 RepID=A0ABW4JUY9_9HYPH|nr:TspO/MBR family protein [Roseibium aestuarii]
MKKALSLAGFLALVVGGGLAIGFLFMPGAWYQGLEKPAFTPPGWLFGPAWTTLYVLIAIAGWRTWLSGDRGAMRLWMIQLLLNFMWSPIVFGLNNLLCGLVVILAMWVSILAFIGNRWSRDMVAAALFLPYLGWVSFATYLNAGLVVLN